jgi:hypothetical protein
MRTTTSKVPSVANWSRDTTNRLVRNVRTLRKDKPVESAVYMISLIEDLLSENHHLRERIAQLEEANEQ